MGRLSPSMTDSTLPVDAPNGTAAGRLDLGSPSGKVRAFHGVLALPKLRAGNTAGPSSNGRTPDFGSGNGGSSPPGPIPTKKKNGRGGLTPARASLSRPGPYGLGWSGFASFASLTSRSAARSASFASDSDRPRLWSV